MRLLLVEDDQMIGEAVRDLLAQDGYAVDWARDGHEAQAAVLTCEYDLVLLDLGLPGRGGLDVLRSLRGRQRTTPVLIATARDAVEARIAGLDAGGDDYLVKPYDLGELLARVRALLRRAHGQPVALYSTHDVEIDLRRRCASVGGRSVTLSLREWSIVDLLLARPGAVLSRAQLEERLYGWEREVASNAVEVSIHGLRKKLGAEVIRNVRGVGYMMPKG